MRARHLRDLPLPHMPTSARLGSPDNGIQNASLLLLGGETAGSAILAEPPPVVTVTFTDVAVEPLRVTELGTEHVDCAGTPLQLKLTV